MGVCMVAGICSSGGHAWQWGKVCIVGGMHGRGHVWWGGMHGRGHTWQWGGMHGRGHAWQGVCMSQGVCMVGCVCGRGHAWQGGMCDRGHACHAHPSNTMRYGQSMRGQYAYYWNAFLFFNVFEIVFTTQVKILILKYGVKIKIFIYNLSGTYCCANLLLKCDSGS